VALAIDSESQSGASFQTSISAHHALHAVFEGHHGTPAELAGDQGNVGPGDIRFAGTLRNVRHRPADQLDEAIDALRIACPEVPHLADLVGFGGPEKCRGNIARIKKIAPLGSIADNRKGLAGELLPKKDAEYGAIRPCGADPGAVSVEDANGVDRQAVDLVPVEGRLLAHQLRERIRILRVELMVLAGRRIGEPVAGRGGRVDELLHAGGPRCL